MKTFHVSDWLRYLLKKWWIVVIGIVLGALFLGVPRWIRPDADYRFVIRQQFLLTEAADSPVDTWQSTAKGSATMIWQEDTHMVDFVSDLPRRYAMWRFCPTWPQLTKWQQVEMLNSLITSRQMGDTPVYELQFELTVPLKNRDYGKQALGQIFAEYTANMEATIAEVSPGATVQYLAPYELTYTEVEPWQAELNGWYFAAGGAIGLVLSLFALMVLFFAQKREDTQEPQAGGSDAL